MSVLAASVWLHDPEGELALLLRDRLGILDADDLGLLIAVGGDLPGAVAVRAANEDGAMPRPAVVRPAEDETMTLISRTGPSAIRMASQPS
jgi:hypothetical protein